MVVQELEAEHHARGIEAGARLAEHLLMDVHHEIAAVGVLHDEAHVLGRLKAREQIDEERMVAAIDDLEYALLGHEALDLLAEQYVALLERLERIVLAVRLALRQYDLAEVAATQHADEAERVKADARLLLLLLLLLLNMLGRLGLDVEELGDGRLD